MAWQKGQSGNPAGQKYDKPFADALRLAVKRYLENDPAGRTALQAVADTLVADAVAGNIHAIKELADRLDGKAKQQTEVTGADGEPMIVQVIRFAAPSSE